MFKSQKHNMSKTASCEILQYNIIYIKYFKTLLHSIYKYIHMKLWKALEIKHSGMRLLLVNGGE